MLFPLPVTLTTTAPGGTVHHAGFSSDTTPVRMPSVISPGRAGLDVCLSYKPPQQLVLIPTITLGTVL